MAYKIVCWTGTRWIKKTLTSSGKILHERELKNLTPPNGELKSGDSELSETIDNILRSAGIKNEKNSRKMEDSPQEVAESILSDVSRDMDMSEK